MNDDLQTGSLDLLWNTEVLPANLQAIARAAELLRNGEPVAMPTETVYGLAADALNEDAILKVFHAKRRPANDPLIVHVAGEGADWTRDPLVCLDRQGLVDLSALGETARHRAHQLLEVFWPGPLTLVLPRGKAVFGCVTAGLPNVAVRMPRHPVARNLILEAGRPLAAPSANRFGRISPTSAADVLAELSGRIPLVLDGGPCEVGLESTVVLVSAAGDLQLLRPGAVSALAITRALGIVESEVVVVQKNVSVNEGCQSPGMAESHYAPGKPFHILPAPVAELTDADSVWLKTLLPDDVRWLGLLVFFGDATAAGRRFVELTGRAVQPVALSAAVDAEEAARALFREMRRLDDHSTAQVLFAEPCRVDDPLAVAIRDRLRRATTR